MRKELHHQYQSCSLLVRQVLMAFTILELGSFGWQWKFFDSLTGVQLWHADGLFKPPQKSKSLKNWPPSLLNSRTNFPAVSLKITNSKTGNVDLSNIHITVAIFSLSSPQRNFKKKCCCNIVHSATLPILGRWGNRWAQLKASINMKLFFLNFLLFVCESCCHYPSPLIYTSRFVAQQRNREKVEEGVWTILYQFTIWLYTIFLFSLWPIDTAYSMSHAELKLESRGSVER